MNRHSEGSRIALPTHTTSARPLCLAFKVLALLLLLGALLTRFDPIPALAHFTHTQITSSTGSDSYWPSGNASSPRAWRGGNPSTFPSPE